MMQAAEVKNAFRRVQAVYEEAHELALAISDGMEERGFESLTRPQFAFRLRRYSFLHWYALEFGEIFSREATASSAVGWVLHLAPHQDGQQARFDRLGLPFPVLAVSHARFEQKLDLQHAATALLQDFSGAGWDSPWTSQELNDPPEELRRMYRPTFDGEPLLGPGALVRTRSLRPFGCSGSIEFSTFFVDPCRLSAVEGICRAIVEPMVNLADDIRQLACGRTVPEAWIRPAAHRLRRNSLSLVPGRSSSRVNRESQDPVEDEQQ